MRGTEEDEELRRETVWEMRSMGRWGELDVELFMYPLARRAGSEPKMVSRNIVEGAVGSGARLSVQ